MLAHLELLTTMDPRCAQPGSESDLPASDARSRRRTAACRRSYAEATGDQDAMDAARTLAGRLEQT